MLCTKKAFKKIVSKEKYSTYMKFLGRSFVEGNPLVKWCPAPACVYCIRIIFDPKKGNKIAVECNCGFRWCFNCSDYEMGDHSPVANCELIEQWKQKQQSENENVVWLMENTKKCPNCKSPIEKKWRLYAHDLLSKCWWLWS